MKNEELYHVVDIWYKTSVIAHNFISKEYWKSNKKLMETKYIPCQKLM